MPLATPSSSIRWNSVTRRWFLSLCLVAIIATVWLLPYRPNCNALAWDDDPAIAPVDSECIPLSDYAERLRIVEAGIEYAERERLPDDPYPVWDNLRARHELVISHGPETVALADAIMHSALYQKAVDEGHTPKDEEVAAHRDRARLRSEGIPDFIELVRLVEKSDSAGIRELMERSVHPDFETILRDMSLPELRESFGGLNGSKFTLKLEKSQEEWEAYLESVGHERYWNEIFVAEASRSIPVDNLRSSVLDISADGPYEVAGLAWLDCQQEALDGVVIRLTDAAPPPVSVESARAYLAASQELERDSLHEEYRRFMERRGER